MPGRRMVSIGGLVLLLGIDPILAATMPLFTDDAPVKAVLRAPLRDVYSMSEQDAQLYSNGEWIVNDADGKRLTFSVKVKPRGNFRREHCDWPPLKLNFKKREVKKTLLNGQDKLKLVHPCRSGGKYQRYVIQEYMAYRIYALLSEASFRVRGLNLNLIDTNGSDPRVVFAFVIEDDSALAERMAMTTVSEQRVRRASLDERAQAVFDLFQFLIANTDWSAVRGEPDKPCCHNAILLAPPDSKDRYIAVPFDFDFAGLVNASYARPGGVLATKLRSVRQRYYWGFCRDEAEMMAAVDHFNTKRAAIEALYRTSSLLDDATVEDTIDYIDKFYAIINSARRRDRLIVGRCR